MNRRSFLKWMLAFLVVLAASFAFIPLGKWLRTTLNINVLKEKRRGRNPKYLSGMTDRFWVYL
ncbi:hypothetical protein ABNC00_16520 [Paenibacillus larvae]